MLKLGRLGAWNSAQKQAVIPFPQAVTEEMRNTMPSDITVVAFHTDDAFYTHEAERMCASAQRLGIPVKTTVVQSQGDWVKNTSFKAHFLEQARQDISGAMLYVDVDAVFHRSPLAYLSQLDCDIAAHYDEGDDHLISATLFFQDTPAAKQLIEEWNRQCKLRPDVWDQKVLEDILAQDQQQAQPQYRIQRLPVAFCWVFDRETNLAHLEKMPVYIEQLQASRSVREEVRKQGKKRLISRPSKQTQRRMDRVKQIEDILFGK